MSEASDKVIGFLGFIAIGMAAYYWYDRYETSKAPTLEQQRSCSEAAERYEKDSGGTDPQTSYYSHYNNEYGRCFVETTTLGSASTIRTVGDAMEHTDYASYAASLNPPDPSQVMDCKVKLPEQEYKQCKNLDEWNELIKPLMGSGEVD